MIGTKKRLEQKIIELEEKGKYLEEKTKQATELLESLMAEFDDLQNSILVSQSSQSQTQTPAPALSHSAQIAPQSGYYNNYSPPDEFNRPSVFQETKELSSCIDITYLKPGRIDMTGAQEENHALKYGWWPSNGSFRWAGKDSKDPVLYFNIYPGKEYELTAKLFVPDALAKKPISVFANDTCVANFTVDKETQLEKKISIPSGIVTDDRLKIVFRADFWRPKDQDPNVKDDRTLSLAFEYIELK